MSELLLGRVKSKNTAPHSEGVIVLEKSSDPDSQIKNLENYLKNLVNDPVILGFLKTITQGELKGIRQSYINHPNDIFGQLIVENADAASFALTPDASQSKDQISKTYLASLKYIKLRLDQLSPEDFFGFDNFDDASLVSEKMRKMYSSLLQRGHKSASVTILSKLISEKQNVPSTQRQVEVVASDKKTESEPEPKPEFMLLLPGQKSEVSPELPQPWLNLEREKDFETVLKGFTELYDRDPETRKAFQEWFVENMNTGLGLHGEKALTLEDVTTLVLRECFAVKASEVAGYKIVRPVLLFVDPKQYFSVLQKVLGEEAHSSAMVLSFEGDTSNVLIRTGFIFASRENATDLGHEIMHTIDPYMTTRKGYDILLTEAFAFCLANHQDPEAYKKLLGHYFIDFTQKAAAAITESEYFELVSKVVDKIVFLIQQIGEIEALRQLVQFKTVAEFLEGK